MDKKTCKHCGVSLIVKQTKRTPEQLKKSYYYTAYYYCPRCHRMYHDDTFKVTNNNYDLFTKKELPPTEFDIEIWTDGACSHNGTPRAKAAWAFVSGEYEASGLVEGRQTNNTAEALAIYHAFVWAAEKGYQKIKISSDSQITLHGLQKEVSKIKANQEIFAKIFNVIEKNNLQVAYEKVLGHADNVNNNRADKLANMLVGISSS